MCDCTSCKATDSFHGGFTTWPKGERAPATVFGRDKIPADKAYKAHWAHCGAEAHRQRAKLDTRMVLPRAGVPQTDPRISYSFPGGQVAQYRHGGPGSKLYERRDSRIPATENVAEYVRLFCKENNLTL